MRDLKSIETSVLVDMLAQETAKFSELFRIYFSVNGNPDYESCKENIQYIVAELRNRKVSLPAQEPAILKDMDETNSAKVIPFSSGLKGIM